VIGLSTHDMRQVARAQDEPVNYLGFGPLFPTATKGYEHGLGPDAAWIADTASELPLFPIGGIDATNAAELARVGRAAVSTAILDAEDPGRAASEIRGLLTVT
jgi:thiamine-phosphate pyrophosphorylase